MPNTDENYVVIGNKGYYAFAQGGIGMRDGSTAFDAVFKPAGLKPGTTSRKGKFTACEAIKARIGAKSETGPYQPTTIFSILGYGDTQKLTKEVWQHIANQYEHIFNR